MAEIQIGEFAAPVKENPYTPAVKALADADAKLKETDPNKDASATIRAASQDVSKTARAFGDAANALGYTARRRLTLVGEDEVTTDEVKELAADTEVSLVFTLGPKQVRPGRPRKDAEGAPAKGKK